MDFQWRKFVPRFEGEFSVPCLDNDYITTKVKALGEVNDLTYYSTNNPKEKYIFVGSPGGILGNNIFEFISGLAIGRTLNRTVLSSQDITKLFQVFLNTRPYMHWAPISIDCGFDPLPLIEESGAAYYEDWLHNAIPKDVNMKICCYFQSYKYYQDMEKEVSQKYLAKVSDLMQ